MIESISIADIATYGSSPEILSGLSKFNYIYGANASGKTTISRVIADQQGFPSCCVTWDNGTNLQAMVYNRDFIEKNFNQPQELKGIFTLGEQDVETVHKISAAKIDLDGLTRKIQGLNKNLNGDDDTVGKKRELENLEEELKNTCWEQKKKHDEKFQGAFEGFRNNAEKFKEKILQELASNSAALDLLATLEKKTETVFGPTPEKENSVLDITADALIAYETNPILKKRIIGKEDVDIAVMIKKLGNSDWVREGRGYYEANEKICPFCQQSTTDAFAKSLSEYFDETFENDTRAIKDLEENYRSDAALFQDQIESIIGDQNRFLDVEKLRTEQEILDSKITMNLQRLTAKKREPSQVIELESLENVFDQIKVIIAAANKQITEHNEMVSNLAQERVNLTAQVWKYLLEVELKIDITTYMGKRGALQKAIDSIIEQITAAKKDKAAKDDEIRELEKHTTSIQPTVDAINLLLTSFGFQGFPLSKADHGSYYKLVRPDGTDAKETLSEGEKSFITFLYFYHLLKGSDSESGITTDRVVVFDDPVSSLDSDILFIVSSLIKGLFEEVREGVGHIKQVFVMTHNVYFHREVTFNPKRRDVAMKEETFWVVRKSGQKSRIEKYNSNPIKTSYDLLWAEVRKPDPESLTIQNTLRRILENYFKITGGVDPNEICGSFEGKEKLICRSLFYWVNAGSHNAHDDLYVSTSDSMVDVYLEVFKGIFDKTGHSAHYNMMMREKNLTKPSEDPE